MIPPGLPLPVLGGTAGLTRGRRWRAGRRPGTMVLTPLDEVDTVFTLAAVLTC